jgi:hypothetical protein
VAGRGTSSGRSGEVEIKDPFEQARRAEHRLAEVLGRRKRGAGERMWIGHAVAFPDSRVGRVSLGPAAPPEILIDADDLGRLDRRLEELFRYWRGKKTSTAPGGDGIRTLEQVLANSFELRAPLAVELAEEERELLRLTEGQYRVLDVLSRQPRAAISGCAGSGKTFLAAEKARRLAAQGFRVLVLCFNRMLGEYLRRGLADVPEIDACTFDELCLRVAREAGIELTDQPAPGEEGAYFRAVRAAFADSVDTAAGRYGVIVVDEAQDFAAYWWLPLQLLLESPGTSPLYVFFDDNQRIFPVAPSFPVSGEPFPLGVNCRNTKAINRVVADYYDGDPIEALGPEGPPVQVTLTTSPADLERKLDDVVSAWLRDAEVRPDDVALLTPRSIERSLLGRLDRVGGAQLTDDPWAKGKIVRSSIHRFKGLERLVVGLVELESVRHDVLYVGLSRPKVFLSLFWPESQRDRLPRGLGAMGLTTEAT